MSAPNPSDDRHTFIQNYKSEHYDELQDEYKRQLIDSPKPVTDFDEFCNFIINEEVIPSTH